MTREMLSKSVISLFGSFMGGRLGKQYTYIEVKAIEDAAKRLDAEAEGLEMEARQVREAAEKYWQEYYELTDGWAEEQGIID